MLIRPRICFQLPGTCMGGCVCRATGTSTSEPWSTFAHMNLAGMWHAALRLYLLWPWVAVLHACGSAAADINANGRAGAFNSNALSQSGAPQVQGHGGLALASTLFDPSARIDFSDGVSGHGRSLLKICRKGKKIKKKCVPACR